MGEATAAVLLVEDTADNAAAARRAFASHANRFRLTMASCLEEARERIAEARPDVVISELVLPDGRATELLPPDEDRPPFPLVVIVPSGDIPAGTAAKRAGAFDYVLKAEMTMGDMPHIAERAFVEWNLAAARDSAAAQKNHTEDALRTSQEAYRTHFDAVPFAISVWQKVEDDFLLINRNAVAAEIMARDMRLPGNLTKLTGIRCRELYADYPDTYDNLLRCYTEKAFHQRETPDLAVPDAKRNWYRVSYAFVPPDMVLTVTEDITERKRAEEALHRSEQLFRLVVERAFDGINISEYDPVTHERKLVFCNDRYVEISGFTREELYNADLNQLVVFHLTKEEKESQPYYHCILNGIPYGGIASWKRPDGKENFYEWRAVAVKQGDKYHIIGVDRDVTERRAAERRLQLSNRFLMIANRYAVMPGLLTAFVKEIKRFADCEAVGIRVLDKEGNIPYRAYDGFSEDFYAAETSVSIKNDECMCTEVIRDANDAKLPCCTESGSFHLGSLSRFLASASGARKKRMRNKCHEAGYESVALIPIRVAGRILGLIHLADRRENMFPLNLVLTLEAVAMQLGIALQRVMAEEEQRQLEAQILQTAKLEGLGVLAGGIAHDFNNLLMGILGYAEIALLNLDPGSPMRRNIEHIETAARRATELTGQLLAYSGKGKFVIEPFDLAKVVKEMTPLLEVSTAKRAVIDYHFDERLPIMEGDVTQIRQIIMNLITNAAEAIGDKRGIVSVSVGAMECDRACLSEMGFEQRLPPGTYVYLEVSDTGCGMDQETISRVFDPFFTTKFTGRGLGLAAVLGIVRGHHGAVKVSSEPGRGSTFKILFPASGQRRKPAEAAQPTMTDWRGAGTILVVDGEETVRGLAQEMLEHLGFTVLTATSGREAVALLRRHTRKIRAVLLDMNMPNEQGEESLRELRRIKEDVPVILSSGYNEQEATGRFAGKGLAGFIQKPYRISDLAEKMRRALGD